MTIRTRLDAERVRERLGALAARGEVQDQRVVGDAFSFDYLYLVGKDPQSYGIQGVVRHTPEWRFVDLRIEADTPWLSWRVLAALSGLVALKVLRGRFSAPAAVGMTVLVVAIEAVAKLAYVPYVVRRRVAAALARELHGSVREGDRWVVPG